MLDVLQEGLKVSVLGMGVVFFALGALAFVLRLFGSFLGGTDRRQAAIDAAAPQGGAGVLADASPELAAVVAAVLAALECSEGSVRVTSVSRADK